MGNVGAAAGLVALAAAMLLVGRDLRLLGLTVQLSFLRQIVVVENVVFVVVGYVRVVLANGAVERVLRELTLSQLGLQNIGW